LNHNGFRDPDDVTGSTYGFEYFLYSQNNDFNPAADINGDGSIDTWDLLGLSAALVQGGAPQSSLHAWSDVMFRRVNFFSDEVLDGRDLALMRAMFGTTDGPNLWLYDLTVDGIVDEGDLALMMSSFGVVPEPSGLILALLATAGMVRFRARPKIRVT